jgi:hypothetical protein
MDMDVAAVFLAGSILTVMGFLVILAGIIIANNMIHKYWKSFGWKLLPSSHYEPTRFMTEEEANKIAPHFEEAQNGKSQEKRNA